MWKRSFVATTVALGGTVDDALASIRDVHQRPEGGAALDALCAGLRAPHRAARATALADAVRDIVVAIDRAALR